MSIRLNLDICSFVLTALLEMAVSGLNGLCSRSGLKVVVFVWRERSGVDAGRDFSLLVERTIRPGLPSPTRLVITGVMSGTGGDGGSEDSCLIWRR